MRREGRFKAPKEGGPPKAAPADAAGSAPAAKAALDIAERLKGSASGAGVKRARADADAAGGSDAAKIAREAERQRLLPEAKKTKRAAKDKAKKDKKDK